MTDLYPQVELLKSYEQNSDKSSKNHVTSPWALSHFEGLSKVNIVHLKQNINNKKYAGAAAGARSNTARPYCTYEGPPPSPH